MTSRLTVRFFYAVWLLVAVGSSAFQAWGQAAYRLKADGFGVDAVPGWPVYLAQEKGFLAKEGIQLDFARSHQQMMALIGCSLNDLASLSKGELKQRLV